MQGMHIGQVRELIRGPSGSLVTLSLQPPGAQQSYVEDVIILRNENMIPRLASTASANAQRTYQPLARDSTNSKAKEPASRDSLFGWMGNIMCWGPRRTSERPRSGPAGTSQHFFFFAVRLCIYVHTHVSVCALSALALSLLVCS